MTSSLQKTTIQTAIFIVVILIYIVTSLVLASVHTLEAHYHVSSVMAQFIDLTIYLPVAVIYSLAFYGFSRVYAYARKIKPSREGKMFRILAWGLGILAYVSPLAGTLSAILNRIATNHPSFLPTTTILNNYISIIISLLAFLCIGFATFELASSVKARASYASVLILGFVLALLGVGFCYLLLTNGLEWGASLSITRRIYYLPPAALVLTVTLPYIFTWFLGLLAASNLYLYNREVPGAIYKKHFNKLSYGFGLVIMASVLIQYITALSSRVVGLRIGPLLLIIYPLLAFLSIGYIFIALGAKSLHKIEEV